MTSEDEWNFNLKRALQAPTPSTIQVLDNVSGYVKLIGIDPNTTPYKEVVDKMREDVKPAFFTDLTFWRMALNYLGIIIFFSILSAFVLAALEKPIPEILISATSTLIGVLAGLFASTLKG